MPAGPDGDDDECTSDDDLQDVYGDDQAAIEKHRRMFAGIRIEPPRPQEATAEELIVVRIHSNLSSPLVTNLYTSLDHSQLAEWSSRCSGRDLCPLLRPASG